ncbi:YihY/virulence factor BrkB family protein [Leekyejoonella antrihumi]|uniref:YihY/virulence factor BrkB family protein n=2 Tax=Leekyejoonella antrihumi TaxID=1660198 RepID=A0A563E0Y1_9MICO|nr:YihY/virulence factor BrkB family protein [Leekyejoonella antrihumi]
MTVETVRVCMQYRVTGLAAEAGYFALLSLPPLVFGLLGGVGYLGDILGHNTVATVTRDIENYASGFLTEASLNQVLMPTIRDALGAGRPDVISIGFLLSLWSGSRCLNVLLDTISIMYSQGGKRGIVRTRILSLSLYLLSLLFGAIVVPLTVIGPDVLGDWLPAQVRFLMVFYWPLVGGLTILGFATLYYIATPQRTPWVRDLPGAALTLATWVVTSMALRWALNRSIVGGLSIYGPLAATIVVLIWLYFLSIGVLIGAALNAATVRLWPPPELLPVRERARALIEDGVSRLRERDDGVDDTPGVEPDEGENRPLAEVDTPVGNRQSLDSSRAIG